MIIYNNYPCQKLIRRDVFSPFLRVLFSYKGCPAFTVKQVIFKRNIIVSVLFGRRNIFWRCGLKIIFSEMYLQSG